MKNSSINKNQNGFTLLEILLTTIILAGIMVVVFSILEDYAENIQARSTAQYMEDIGLAVEDIVNDPEQYDRVYNIVSFEPNLILELSLNDLINGFGLPPNDIPPSSRLNPNFRDQTPLRTGTEIMIKIGDNIADPNDVRVLEIIVATDAPVTDERTRKVASHLEGAGGAYRVVADGIRNSFNSWQLNVAEFNGSNWGNIITTAPPTIADGGYILYYKHITEPDALGDYLYRDYLGNSEYNTMYAPLNMGSNNILGADNIDATGDVEFANGMIVNGGMQVTGNTTFNNANLIVNNRLNAPNAIIRGTSTTRPSGNLQIDGSLSANTLSVLNNVQSDVAIFESGFDTTGDISGNLVRINDGLTAEGLNITSLSGNGVTYDVNIGDTLFADDVGAGSIGIAGNGGVGAITTQIGGNMNVGGDFLSNNIGFTSLTVDTFGACDNGC